MKQLMTVKFALILLFRKTSFLFGIVCGLAFGIPIITWQVIPNALLRTIIGLAIAFAGFLLCANMAENMMKRFNGMLYTDLEPERFVDEFTAALYTKKPEKWNILGSIMLGQAYHAMGNFKDEEAQYIRQLNKPVKNIEDEIARKNELGLIGRLVIAYSDADNAEAAEKAFVKFRETAAKITDYTDEQALEDLKNLAYNCYLKVTGKTEECLGYFEWRCENSRDELSRIFAHFRLAEAYEAGGYAEDAQKEYRIVAEQGRKLYCAEKARQKLDTLCIDGAKD